MVTDRNVLITGGAGYVGRKLVRSFLAEDPKVIRIFDQNEAGLASLEHDLTDGRCRFLMGDVRDRARLDRAMEEIDVVVHAAALKHVHISEYNPFEAVKTNVVGLQNVIDAAIDEDVKRLVFTSSDKAAYPANTMGTTKLLGEKLVTAGNKYSGGRDIRLSSVRFGNVVSSSQSVVPIFKEQIRKGGPVTVTDPTMTRFFLTHDELALLVNSAIERSKGGEVFVNKMSSIRIADLAEAMIEIYAPEFGHDPADIEITTTERRVGETYHEEIMTEREMQRALESDERYVIPPESKDDVRYSSWKSREDLDPASDVVRSSGDASTLSKVDIKDMLEDEEIR